MLANENMNANGIKLPLVIRIALWLWIVVNIGGAVYCCFEGEVNYKGELCLFDEVMIYGSIVIFVVEFVQIVRLFLHRSSAVKILICCEFLDLLLLPLTYRSLAEAGESLLEWVFPAALPYVAIILLLLSTSARRWVAMTRKYNGKTMARALMFFLCSAFFIWDAFGTSLSNNDLAYIENDAVELPPGKEHLLLILKVVDDETKVNVKTNLMFWDDFVYDDKGHVAMFEKLSRCKQVNALTFRYATTDKKEVRVPVSAFAAMTNLTSLSIYGCGCPAVVSSFKSLSCIPLEDISLMNVDLRELSSLRDLPKLTGLATNKPEILANVPESIESLELDGIDFPGVCDLSRFTNLTSLVFHNVGTSCYVAGINKMQRLKKLEIVGLCDLWTKSIGDDVLKCSNLRSLTLQGGHSWFFLIDTKPLGALPLEYIDFSSVPIRFLRGLEACPLEEVRLNQCPVRDIDCLCAMPRLKFLDVCHTGIMLASRDELKKRFPNLEHFECTKADASVQYEDW